MADDVFVGVDIGRKRDLTVIWQAQQRGGILRTFNIVVLSKTLFREQYRVLKKLLSDRHLWRGAGPRHLSPRRTFTASRPARRVTLHEHGPQFPNNNARSKALTTPSSLMSATWPGSLVRRPVVVNGC